MRILIVLISAAMLAGCAVNTAPRAPGYDAAFSELSRRCSAEADARDLHGAERMAVRGECLQEGLRSIRR